MSELVEMNVYPKVFTNALLQLIPDDTIVLHAPGSLITDIFPVFFFLDNQHGLVIKYDLRETMLDFADFTYMEEFEIVEELMAIEYLMNVREVEQYVDFLIYRDINTPQLEGLLGFLAVMKGMNV
ncbi:MAG: hypothetical protein IM547_01545 [Chitinophagaceae bacterium]|nr:hypothetical protein [Chitinophagaceae bacterium]